MNRLHFVDKVSEISNLELVKDLVEVVEFIAISEYFFTTTNLDIFSIQLRICPKYVTFTL